MDGVLSRTRNDGELQVPVSNSSPRELRRIAYLACESGLLTHLLTALGVGSCGSILVISFSQEIMDQADGNNTDDRMDKAWHAAEAQVNSISEERMDKAWQEAEARVNSSRSSSAMINGGHKLPKEETSSPLMARDDTEVEDENDPPRQFLVPQDCRSEEMTRGTSGTPAQTTENLPTNSIIQRYRRFLRKHEPSLDILESVTERVFYGYLFKNDPGIKSEIYYSIWNSFRFANEIILSGLGDGLGTTVGTRREWLAGISDQEHGSFVEDMVLAKLSMAIPILRTFLSATTCFYPAFEAWSRRSARRNVSKSSYGTPLYIFNNGDTLSQTAAEHELPESTTDLSPKRRRREWESQMRSAAQMSYRLQRVRFVARLTLLAVSWFIQRRRKLLQDSHEKENRNQKSQVVHSLLRRGGELDPYEQVVPLRVADEEVMVAQYVGRRTGRRSVARLPQTDKAATQSRYPWLTRFTESITKASSSKNKVLYIYAVGEILNILRPLYWSRAEARQWTHRFSTPQIQKRSLFGSCYTYRIWIAYWVSLAMDLVSDRLLRNVQEKAPNNGRRGAVQSQGGAGRPSASPSASQASLDELEWRRSRHGLYLLRSPMYESATRPVAVFLARIISKVPSFGLARWAAEYALDLMSYWNSKRFMLES